MLRRNKHLLRGSGRHLGAVFVLMTVVFGVLLLDMTPAVEREGRPTARDISAAHHALRQLKAAQGTETAARIRFDNTTIRALAALAGDVSGWGRTEAEVTGGALVAKASISLPAGLWLNTSATVTGSHARFPDFRLKVGRVIFPPGAGRRLAHFGRWVFRQRGAEIPPLDDVVKQLAIHQNDVVADLVLPPRTGVAEGVIAASAGVINDPLVSDIYCRLAAEQRAEPVGELSSLMRKAFNQNTGNAVEEQNRATFIALSFLVVGEKAHALAPRAASLAKKCPYPNRTILLHDREDLAKHWVFSAALTSVLGNEAALSLGEWKELDDSLPGGSGFSFVDLAADRSGVRIALRGLDSNSAKATADMLGHGSDQDLLPETLLGGMEGMSELSFEGRFGGLTEERYSQAITRIDRELARQERAGHSGT